MMKFSQMIVTLLAFAIVTLPGCTIGPRIDALHDPEADFSKFNTYNFAPEAKAGEEAYASLLTQHLKKAISQEMESRGYRKTDAPDILVNFYVSTKEKIQTSETPSLRPRPYYYYSYRYGYYHPWPYYEYETRITQYTEGTLNIDLINANAKQLVWEGVAVGRVRESAKENMQQNVNNVVGLIFAEYHFVAGKAEPVIVEEKK